MPGDSRIIHLNKYRDSVHSVVKPCAHCQTNFETKFGMYCSTLCRNRAHRKKKQVERLKDLVCFFCGCQVTNRQSKFCSTDHKNSFHKANNANKAIKIRLDHKTIIETKKYDSIPEVIKMYNDQKNNFN